ncbi:signal recognition particle receptor subunit beta-like [Zophobas morio]|uniref:signal recognition particle receptor subunit beta-like n=1 Tax=Zophobas morio TaxID=2755281 RepID=UPI00308361C3
MCNVPSGELPEKYVPRRGSCGVVLSFKSFLFFLGFIIITSLSVLILVKKKKKLIIIIGLCESGKTTLLLRLALGQKSLESCTSTIPNVIEYPNSGKRLARIVDIPGHECVRKTFLKTYNDKADGVIFVVDSSALKQQAGDVADYLYFLLERYSLLKKRVPFLVFCNKSDSPLSLDLKFIKACLERECSSLSKTEMMSQSSRPLAKKEFKFSQITDFAQFAKGSCAQQALDIGGCLLWLDQLIYFVEKNAQILTLHSNKLKVVFSTAILSALTKFALEN